MTDSSHGVKTRGKAREWTGGVEVEVPVVIDQLICVGCGRLYVRVIDSAGGVVVRG